MSQNEMVLRFMETRGPITPMAAKDDLGIMRLAARISDIRNGRGVPRHRVCDRYVTVKNKRNQDCRVKSYWLDSAPPVHYMSQAEGFLAVAPCGFEGVLSCGFTKSAEKVTCPGCRAAGVDHG